MYKSQYNDVETYMYKASSNFKFKYIGIHTLISYLLRVTLEWGAKVEDADEFLRNVIC